MAHEQQRIDIRAGVWAGAARFYQEVQGHENIGDASRGSPGPGRDMTPEAVKDILERAADLAASALPRIAKWHSRAIRLFAELVTVGVLSRWYFQEEDDLGADQLFGFSDGLENLLNSFVHLRLP